MNETNNAPTFPLNYPAGWEPIETLRDGGGIVVEVVAIAGKRYQREFNTATGDNILRPLF